MKAELVNIQKLQFNSCNPRIIKDNKLHKLVNSILVLPKMLELRPLVGDNYIILGGNQRLRSLQLISEMKYSALLKRLKNVEDYKIKSHDEQKRLEDFWKQWLDNPVVPYVEASELTDAEKKEFIIKDNVSFGSWNFDGTEWNIEQLKEWGIEPADISEEKKKDYSVREDDYDETVNGIPYAEIVEVARDFIRERGGFEKFAE